MKIQGKIMSLMLTTLLTVSMTACSSGTAANSGDGEKKASAAGEDKPHITIGSYIDPANQEDPSNAKWMEFYEHLTEQTGVEIEIQTIPWDQIESKMVVTNMAGSPSADMYMISSQKLASVVNAGAALPLDDYIDENLDRSQYMDVVFTDGTFIGDGKVYCMPVSIHSRGLWYNKELMPNAPTTRDELLEYAIAATDEANKVYGFGFYGPNDYGSMEVSVAPFIWDAGGTLCDEEGKATWATDETADAIQFLSDCVNVHKVSPQTCLTSTQYADIQDMFTSGHLAAYIDGTYADNALKESQLYKDGKIGFVPLPGKKGPAPNFSNGWSFSLASNSPNADACWKVIEAIQQPENQTMHAAFDGGLPTTLESYDDPMFSTPMYKAFKENMDYARGMDPFLHYQEGLEAISNVKSSYFMDPTQDLTKLLEDAQEQFNKKFYD